MSDRDDFAELVASARNVTKCPSFYFHGRIRYGTKGEKVEDRFLCMDVARVYICSVKIPVKIESQFNILSIKGIDRSSDSHVIIETDVKQSHSLYGLHDKASLQPFLIILIRTIRTIFPHRLQSIVDIRPENEYDRLLRLSNEYFEDKLSDMHICGGFSMRYECACDFYQTPLHRSVQNLVDTVFAHRISREFTFREFESYTQKDWLPIIGALRHNDWFTKLTIENIKLSTESVEELFVVLCLNKTIKDLILSNCGLRQDFCTRFAPHLPAASIENIDLSNNALEDKGLNVLNAALQQRKLPLRSINLQSCSITHKSLCLFNASLANNNYILKSLKILNLSGNRIKHESCVAVLFSNGENVLEELHLSDIEFSLDSFFNTLLSSCCKLRRLHITSTKSSTPLTIPGAVKFFFTKNQTLEILQISNANLSVDFLRELFDGLYSNNFLKNLDLRLSGNPLESFLRECGPHFATIPCLTYLDISGCDLDNEAVPLLVELKRNQKLKSLHIGKNFTNIKPKNLPRIMIALKDLVEYSKLEFLSIADSRLRENVADILLPLTDNTSITTLDIRGNTMGDAGVRALTYVLQINRHLHTIFYDRNLLSLNNFEDIVNALQENNVIQYLPVPITDIILMKTSEKERMEKLQSLMVKLDSLCLRNQQRDKNSSSTDSCLVTTTIANLASELTLAWESQQQLFGDQVSLEYIQSCTNRTNNKNDEIKSILTQPAHIHEVSSELYNLYLVEEERLKDEWNDMCKLFEQRLLKSQENLSKKFYQSFKEQSLITSNDKIQEEIRTHFSNSNISINHLLYTDMPDKIGTYTRECYINAATCLQKRAYDIMNGMATDMHEQMKSTILQAAAPSPQSSTSDGQQHTPTSTLDRLVNRGAQVVHRLAHKHTYPQTDVADDTMNGRTLKQVESTEYVTNPSPKASKSASKDNRLLVNTQSKNPTPPLATSPKPSSNANHRRTVLVTANEQEYNPVYDNFPVINRTKKQDNSFENEGDRIENDLLDLVKQEQEREHKRNMPPTVPNKKRMTLLGQEDNLEVEPTAKLVHLAKDRPRRGNVRPPVRKTTDGVSPDSSSDGGLDNDDNSLGDVLPTSTTESSNTYLPFIPNLDPSTTELPPKTGTKIKAALVPTTTLPPPVPTKNLQQTPSFQTRLATTQQQTTTPLLTTNLSSQIINSDSTHESPESKFSMSMSPPASSVLTNKDDQKDSYSSLDNLSSQAPPVVARTGKVALGTRVLPVLDPSGEGPVTRLRHYQSDKKANSSSTENQGGPDGACGAGDSSISEDNEQYKRLSVRERARMLTTNISPQAPGDKKIVTSTSNVTGVVNEK
ncbi:unnamed protein product [Rotaria magnacalcarata]|uniref:CARMIL pleckstrin homology domain-containing protein n=1 Tax=Rotaria magnacalcarata TaxID=392030 RepID=A0A816MPC9_9BILA|nr:unnamed protein product [Rotaria magnacalcarata]